MTWDARRVCTSAGAELTDDSDGRQVILAWADGALGIPLTVDAARDMRDALDYEIRQASHAIRHRADLTEAAKAFDQAGREAARPVREAGLVMFEHRIVKQHVVNRTYRTVVVNAHGIVVWTAPRMGWNLANRTLAREWIVKNEIEQGRA
jgi:hypothetical protein